LSCRSWTSTRSRPYSGSSSWWRPPASCSPVSWPVKRPVSRGWTSWRSHEGRLEEASRRHGCRSVRIATHDLAARDGPQRTPRRPVDGVLDEPHAPVAQQDVYPAGVITAGGDGGEGRAALLLPLGDEVDVRIHHAPEGAGGLLVRGPGGGEPRL